MTDDHSMTPYGKTTNPVSGQVVTAESKEEFEAADAAVFNLLMENPHLKETVGKVPTGHLRRVLDTALKGAAEYHRAASSVPSPAPEQVVRAVCLANQGDTVPCATACLHCDRISRAVLKLIAAQPAAGVEWKLVPVEPTEEMIDAGSEEYSEAFERAAAENKATHEALAAKYPDVKPRTSFGAAGIQTIPPTYRAMLAAAPQPPSGDKVKP